MEKRSLTGEELLKDTLGMYKTLVNRQLMLMKTVTELKAKVEAQSKYIQTLETSINDKLK